MLSHGLPSYLGYGGGLVPGGVAGGGLGAGERPRRKSSQMCTHGLCCIRFLNLQWESALLRHILRFYRRLKGSGTVS